MMLASFVPMMAQSQGQPAGPASGGFINMLVMFGLVFAIFYFLIIMPSRRKQKKHQEMVDQLKPGDKVITSGGIHGTVMGVQPDRIELKISANVKIDINKNAISVILGQKPEAK